MTIPVWIFRHLDLHGVDYRVRYHRSTHAALGVAEVEQTPGRSYGKTVVVMVGDKPVLFVMPASSTIDLARAQQLVGDGSQRIATRAEIAHFFPDLSDGAIPPLAHWPGVDVWMDPTLRHRGRLLFAAGSYNASIEMDFDDWFRMTKPHVGPFVDPSSTR